MLQTMNSLVANKLTFADSINQVDSGKVIIEASNKESGMEFFILDAKLAFADLKQAFSTTPILHYFYLKYQIQIEIYALKYFIDEILSQLTSDNLGQWYLIVFFS